MNVLIVDDVPRNLKLLRLQLEAEGHDVREAADGAEALAALARWPANAVISDILMPNMDGYRLCMEIRKSEHWRDLPFIFYSSTYSSAADERLALEVGGDRFLAKPAAAGDIAAALREVMAGARAPVRASLTAHGDLSLMRQYSARLVAKLEEQNAELQARTRELDREVAKHELALTNLRDREQRMRLALDAAGAGVWEIDLATGRSTFDERLREIFGLPEDTVGAGKEDVMAAIHPEDQARVGAALRDAVKQRRDYDIVHRIVRPDGSVRWTSVKGRGDYGADGRALRVRGVSVDITARRDLEAAAQREMVTRAELGGIFERITDAFVALDRDWRCVFMNRRAGELFGRDPRQMIGRHLWTEFHEGVDQPFHRAYLRAMETQQAVTFEDYYAPWNRWFENRIYPSPNGISIYFHEITERKLAEERLRLSVAASNVGLWDWNLATNEVFFSPEWKRQLGYANDELPDRFEEWEARVHPEDLAPTLAKVRAFIENPAADYTSEFRMRHKDGSWRWIFTRAQIFCDTAGKPARMLGCHIDITERKRTEEKLRLSEETFSKAFHAGPAGMTITRVADGKFIDVNESFLQMFEYSREDVIGRTSVDLNILSPEERERVIQQQREAGGVRSAELPTRAKSGRVVHLLFSSEPMKINGEDCLVATMIDVTARKQAEAALRESERGLTEAQRIAHVGSWVWNLAGPVQWTDELYRVYGVSPETFTPTIEAFFDLVHPEDRPGMQEWLRACAAGENPGSFEFRAVRPDRTVRSISGRGELVLDAGGRPVRMFGTAQDITERKAAEGGLRDAAERMQALSRRLVETQEVEQRRISAELHDRIGQNLTALGINLNIIGGSLPQPLLATLAPRLKDAASLLEATIGSVRGLMTELRPAVLEDYGLLAGLRALGSEFEARTGIATAVKGEEPVPRLARPTELALFRIAQEALNNTLKHARARHVNVRLAWDAGGAEMSVEDDGAGFDLDGVKGSWRGHWGLALMEERALAVGGHFKVSAAPGRGARINVDVRRSP